MATTLSTEVTFDATVSNTGKSILLEVTSDFGGTSLTWDAPDTAGLVKIVDPVGGASAPFYNNTDTSAPDITVSTKTAANTDVTVATDDITITSHGYYTGQPVIYYLNSGTVISGLTDLTCYYVIVVDSNTIKLATTRANAIAGTQIDLTSAPTGTYSFIYIFGSLSLPVDSDLNYYKGDYDISVYLYDTGATTVQEYRTQHIPLNYTTPAITLTNSYSVITPIFLKSVDDTTYLYDNVTPTISRDFTLYYPQNYGSYNVTTKTLSTSGFYGGSPATHGLKLISTLTYTFTKAYYSDATGVLVPWYMNDIVTKNDEIEVYSNVSGCDIYCCLKTLEEKVEAAKNTPRFAALVEKQARATALARLIQQAYECNKSEDVNDYKTELNRITGCSGCDDCGDSVTQVVGIGTLPVVTKKGFVTVASSSGSVSSYTFSALAGQDFTQGDFIPIVEGEDAECLSGYTITFNAITGTISYGTTIVNGSKIGYRLIR